MATRYNDDDRYGRGSRGGYGRGRSEQRGYEEERWRRNQEWSPSQDTEYQTGSSQGSSYGYGRSGRGFGDYSDADRFGSRSGDYPLGGGDFRSSQGGQGGFGTGQYGYGGTGSQGDYGRSSIGGSGDHNRREINQSRYSGGYGHGSRSYDEGRYGSQSDYGSESGYNQSGGRSQGGQFGAQEQRNFRGRGPKGYTRSDQRIEEDVNERLSDDYYLDASNIEVSVQGGTVTLSGEVDDRESKRRAEDIAEFCSGVQQVQNNIKVQSGGLTGWLFGNGSEESESKGIDSSPSQGSTTSGTSSKKASSSGS